MESLDIPGVVLPLQPAPAKAQQLGGLPQGGQDGVVGVGPVMAVGFAEIQAELIADAAVQARNGALVAVGQGRHDRSAGSDLQQSQNWQSVEQDVAHSSTAQSGDLMNLCLPTNRLLPPIG